MNGRFIELANNCTPFIRYLHVYSAMSVLLIMIFFSITGFLLNHPNWEGKNNSTTVQNLTPPSWTKTVVNWQENVSKHGLRLIQWLDEQHQIRGVDFSIEWDEYESLMIISMQGPNHNVLIELMPNDEELIVDVRKFTFLGMLNNVHRAKHTNKPWILVSDISALIMLLFCLTGLWLICVNKLQRIQGFKWLNFGSLIFVLVIYLMH